MKKIAFLIGILMATLTAGVASASLYDYYSEQGLNLPSVEKRTAIATQCGISDYKGLKSQNIALEACLRGKSDMLGATPTPTSSAARKYVETPDFFLYSPAVSSDTTITLNDLEDIYGNTLTMSDFGTLGYGRIDPDGASVSESFTFTGISANSDGTYTLTGVKSVLAKYPYTQTSGLVRSHSINAIVRFTNTAAFYDSFANKDNNEIIDGIWTYNQFPKFNTSTQIPTTDGQFATKYYVDQVGAGGFTAANVSTTRGLSVDGSIPEKVGINASSTTGMSFDSNGKLYQKLQTNGGILTDSNGLYITTTSLNNAGVVSTTASAGLIPQADTSGKIDYNFVGVDKLNIQPYLTGEFIDASAAPIPVIVSSSGSIYKASTYPSSTSFLGFVPYGTYNTSTNAVVQTQGLVYGFTGLVTNTYYYLNNGIVSIISTTTPDNVVFKIGKSINKNTFLIEKGRKIISGSISFSGVNNFINTTTVNINFNPSKITVYGCGFVDSVSSACSSGNRAIGYWISGNTNGQTTVNSVPDVDNIYLLSFYDNYARNSKILVSSISNGIITFVNSGNSSGGSSYSGIKGYYIAEE